MLSHDATQIRPTKLPFIAWAREALRLTTRVTTRRILHYYRVDSVTHALFCAHCGLNIIKTPYGDNAIAIDSRPPYDHELLCSEVNT